MSQILQNFIKESIQPQGRSNISIHLTSKYFIFSKFFLEKFNLQEFNYVSLYFQEDERKIAFKLFRNIDSDPSARKLSQMDGSKILRATGFYKRNGVKDSEKKRYTEFELHFQNDHEPIFIVELF